MCGIAGSFLLSEAPDGRAADAARAARMAGALAHRGPDAEGLAARGRFALGFRRLAILDLSSAGNQPHSTPDGEVLSVLNGEIYNYRALRAELESQGVRLRSSGDAEVIPHLYRRHGDAFLSRLEGMFSLAVADVARGRLLLARDRFGKKPLYLRVADGRVDFGSEPRALLAAGDPGVAPAVDPRALVRFLAFGYVPGAGSAFLGLERLRPGEMAIAENGSLERRRWYSPPPAAPRARSLDAAAREAWDALVPAVAERLASDVPLGVFLSGGIDSGLVLAAALESRRGGRSTVPRAFTIGFDDPTLDESGLARATAAHLGVETTHEVATLDPATALARIAATFDEPFGDSSALPTLQLCALARRSVVVALSGDGGDECFAGYRRHRSLMQAAALERALPSSLRSLLARALGEAGNGVAGRALIGQVRRFCAALGLAAAERNAYWSTFFRAPLRARFLHPELLAAAGVDPDAEAAADFERAAGSPLRRALAVDLERYLPDDLLVKTDLASMAHSLEVRCPLLDRRVVELSLSLPDDLLSNGSETKPVLRALARARLPPQVAAARKRGFGVPLAAWLRGPLRAEAERRLLSESFASRRILKDGAAAELLARHASGREDWSSYLWLLLVLDAWFERFASRERPA